MAEEAVELTRGDSRLREELTAAEVLQTRGVWTGLFGDLTTQDPTVAWRQMVADRGIAHYQEMEEKDGHYSSQLETRKEGVLSKPRRLTPASEAASDMRVAEFVEDVLDSMGLDHALYELLDALGKGVAIGELMYAIDGREIRATEIRFRPQQAFTFNGPGMPPVGPLRLAFGFGEDQEPLPANKFIVHSFRPHLGNRWGRPLGRRAWWPSWFKRQDIRFWLRFVEKGVGTVLAKFPAGSGDDEKNAALAAAEAIVDSPAAAVADNFAVEILEHVRQGSSDVYRSLAEDYANNEISKIILGQTLTSQGSDQGSGSRALGEVHNEVRAEKIETDSKSLMAAVNGQIIRPLVLLNFGDIDPPKWVIDFEEGEDLNELSQRDERLVKIGVPLSPSYFFERYQLPEPEQGEEPVTPPAPPQPAGGAFAEADADPADPEPERVANQALDEARGIYNEWISKLVEAGMERVQ